MPAPQVDIIPYPPQRGRRAILVDGNRWGVITISNLGPRGASYHFYQEGNGKAVPPPGPVERLIASAPPQLVVHGDAIAIKSRGKTYIPLEERLLAAAILAVKDGRLSSPDAVRAAAAAAEEKRRQEQEEYDRQKLEEMREKAMECLEGFTADGMVVSQSDIDEAVPKIVAAMRWAQQR
jgi:hypothetical protein